MADKMIVVKVTYQVTDEYVSMNKEMIQKFLTDFEQLDNSQFLYTVFQMENGENFVHVSQYKNKDIQQAVLNMPSFIDFQEKRDKHLISEPHIEVLHYLGASKEVF